jgi:hypothetical protein
MAWSGCTPYSHSASSSDNFRMSAPPAYSLTICTALWDSDSQKTGRQLMSTSTEQGPERAYETALRIAAAVLGKLKPRVPVTRATEFCKASNKILSLSSVSHFWIPDNQCRASDGTGGAACYLRVHAQHICLGDKHTEALPACSFLDT